MCTPPPPPPLHDFVFDENAYQHNKVCFKKRLSSKYSAFYGKCTKEKWNIGFVNLDINDILLHETLNVQWMKHTYKDRWFADPFILRITGNDIVLLAEEYCEPIKKGRIVKLIVDKKNYSLKDNDVVLELESHLSFPAIFRKNDDIFIYPESSASGELNLYKYTESENKIEPISLNLDRTALIHGMKIHYL
ncbi:hypothetical protein AGMMS49579_27320 [Spirochaetia bacterium]|nr:hypothetical protein AGMMS49579_27320 [Spirochaetia bacterium]